jgi:hypothetical protein
VKTGCFGIARCRPSERAADVVGVESGVVTQDSSTPAGMRRGPLTICACLFLALAFAVVAYVVPYAWPWRLLILAVMAGAYWAIFPRCRFSRSR